LYCAKNECNTKIIAPKRHQHSSSGANRPSDVALRVNLNALFNLMPDNPIIESFSSDLVLRYCQGFDASAVSPVPPFLSNPSMVAQIGVYLARCCISMQRTLFLPAKLRISISNYAFAKPSPCDASGRTKCSMSC
jgi:hypothetical protein